jgi:hypothetical protein
MKNYVTRQKVVGSIPYEVTGFFNRHNLSSGTMVLKSAQPLNRNED